MPRWTCRGGHSGQGFAEIPRGTRSLLRGVPALRDRHARTIRRFSGLPGRTALVAARLGVVTRARLILRVGGCLRVI